MYRAGSSGMVLGSILGRVLTDAFEWRSGFAINLPLVLVVLVLAMRSVRFDAARPALRGLDAIEPGSGEVRHCRQ